MQLIVLRPDGLCTRLPLRATLILAATLLALMVAAVAGAYWVGQQQREVVQVPVVPGSDQAVIEAAEREVAHEGLKHLAERVVTLERQLARVDLRMRSVGETLDLDLSELVPAMGGQGGPELEGPDSPMAMDERLHALERLLNRHQASVALIDDTLREDASREALRPQLMPVDDEAWISSAFGYRNDPFTGERRFHSGMDFAGSHGSDIRAAGGGVVVFSGKRDAYGKMVEIDHGGGLRTRYAHNSELLVEAGQRVSAGDSIARMGRTGRATDTHLHYEVLKAGRAVNPYDFLPDDD
ncbi:MULTISPECIES: M23 family metallopeptidase [Thioalkalivibrio]|uniref:M23 family metallopeptidase n=1 Tax=Thioalkalivibrio TaxID=106633 RepID=UPI000377CD69|nr:MULTISPECIES: M23 family metallopeptidase [Thioalkalivibrio]